MGEEVLISGAVTVANDMDESDLHKGTLINGVLTLTDIVTPGTYTVTVDNYHVGKITLEKNATTASVTLEYKRFDLWMGWNGAQHDFSKVNDENPTIGNDGATLNVISRDTYDDVAVSLWMKNGNSTNAQGIQGVFIKFEDDKYMFVRCEKMSDGNYKLQWAMNFNGTGNWGGNTVLSVIERYVDFQTPLTADQKTKFDGADGLKVTIARKGNMLYTLIDDTFIGAGVMTLPADYADDKVQVGYWDFDSKANATWKFDIHAIDGIDSETFTNVTFNIDTAYQANGKTVTLSRDGENDIVGTVSDNRFTATNVKGGLWHAKTVVYGVEVTLDDVWVDSSASGVNFSRVFGSGRSVADTKTSNGTENTFYAVSSEIEGNAYFAMKLKCETDAATLGTDGARFGLRMFYEGNKEASMTLCVKGSVFKISECGAGWTECDLTDAQRTALKTDGLYMVVFRNQSEGKVYCYLGTEKNNLTQCNQTWSGVGNNPADMKQGKIVSFGAGFWKGANNKNYIAEISDLMYGTSLDSLGYTMAE